MINSSKTLQQWQKIIDLSLLFSMFVSYFTISWKVKLHYFFLDENRTDLLTLIYLMKIPQIGPFKIAEFVIPENLRRPLRYCGHVLKICELNKNATNDSK